MMTAMFGRTKRPAMSRARGKLVGLHSTKQTNSFAGLVAPPDDLLIGNFFCGFVKGRASDRELAKDAAPLYVPSQAMEYVQYCWVNTFPESYDVPIVVVFGGLDEHNTKSLNGLRNRHRCLPKACKFA
jgi:hypothetical protein